jgi:hypothetical protein
VGRAWLEPPRGQDDDAGFMLFDTCGVRSREAPDPDHRNARVTADDEPLAL